MPLLVDFGVVVALDVALALVSVLVVLPPLLRATARWLPGATDGLAGPVVPVVPAPRDEPVGLVHSSKGRTS
jgi:hypothetical protein